MKERGTEAQSWSEWKDEWKHRSEEFEVDQTYRAYDQLTEECTSQRLRVDGKYAGLVRQSKKLFNARSLDLRGAKVTCLDGLQRRDLDNGENGSIMYKVRPSTFSTRTSDEKDSNVAKALLEGVWMELNQWRPVSNHQRLTVGSETWNKHELRGICTRTNRVCVEWRCCTFLFHLRWLIALGNASGYIKSFTRWKKTSLYIIYVLSSLRLLNIPKEHIGP